MTTFELREDQAEYLRRFEDGEPHKLEQQRTLAPASNLIRRGFLEYTGKPQMYRLTAMGREALARAGYATLVEPTPLSRAAAEALIEDTETQAVLRKVVDDFERRRAKPWGRFLLWLLRKTT